MWSMRFSNYAVLSAVCLALMLQACSNIPVAPTAPTATVDYDHAYDFSQVHKIAIQPIHKDTVATMLISDQLIRRINEALTAELQDRGFVVVTENADADMFLSWKFVPQESATLSTFDPATQKIVQGMLYVNMIDPVMLQSKWRATFKSDLRDQPGSEEAARYRQEAAEAILAQFPPKAITP
jgi:hypothetical protein